jgi:hypothetical protein|tara:strand:- start:4044 stop:4352 length:309 start_codon:yes stop_codon:yes gene_type:complete
MFNRYRNIKRKKDPKTGFNYRIPVLYPKIEERDDDILHIVVVGERLDLLAFRYYNDSGLWWIISRANGLDPSIISPEVGLELKIPQNTGDILTRFESLNSTE